jgi:hypothetical protein
VRSVRERPRSPVIVKNKLEFSKNKKSKG